MPKTYNDVFAEAVRDRSKYPLKSGEYKLREAHRTLEAIRDCILTIRRRVASGQKIGQREDLGMCLGEDRAIWLKRVPQMVVHLLGHDVLPAVAALGADGVPEQEVRRMLIETQRAIDNIIEQCEYVGASTGKRVASEYSAMKAGQSALLTLCDEAMVLLELVATKRGS